MSVAPEKLSRNLPALLQATPISAHTAMCQVESPRFLDSSPLPTHDRGDADTFALTQERLGMMLGVGRQAVDDAAQRLQDAGLIEYGRGVIAVRDRAGLERAACECCAVIRDDFDRRPARAG